MRNLRVGLTLLLGLTLSVAARAGDPAKDAAGDPIPAGARARLGTTRFHCTYGINRLAWAPDGKTIAAVSGNDLQVFDRATGKAVAALAVDTPIGWVVSSLGWTPDGKTIVFATTLEHVCVWTLGTKEPRLIEGAGKDVLAIAVSPDGKTVAAAGDEKVIHVLDLASGKELWKGEGHEGQVRSLAFSKDGKALASAGEDKVVRVWEAASGKELAKVGNPDEVDEVQTVAFTTDGKSVVTAGNQTVRIHEIASGKLTATLFDFDGNTRCLSVAADGKTIASNAGRSILVWSATGPFEAETKPLKKFAGGDETPEALAYSPDGKTIASASGPTLRLFDASTGAEAARPEGHRDAVRDLAWSPDGKTLASTSSDRQLALWDVAGGKARWLPQTEALGGLAWSPDGKTLALGTHTSFDPKVLVLDVASGKVTAELAGHKGSIPAVAFTPDGKTIVSAAFDKTVRLWDVAAKKELASVELPEQAWSVAVAPDGKHFAVGAGKQLVCLYTVATPPVLVRKLSEPTDSLNANGLAFSTDGKVLAVGAGHPRLVEVESGKVLAKGEVDVFTDHVALSPDGKLFASGCGASGVSSVFVFDAASGKQLKKLSGQTGGVLRVAFSRDGKTIASGAQDGTIVLWPN